MPTSASRRAPEAGFTLVELLVVVAIMAVLIGAFATAFFRQPDSGSDEIASLARQLNEARERSLRSGKQITVGVDTIGSANAQDWAGKEIAQLTFHPDASSRGLKVFSGKRVILEVNPVTGHVAAI